MVPATVNNVRQSSCGSVYNVTLFLNVYLLPQSMFSSILLTHLKQSKGSSYKPPLTCEVSDPPNLVDALMAWLYSH
jgi:hypothetical protein